MAEQGTEIINAGQNYRFPRNKCSYGFIINTSGTENASVVIYPMGSGKITKNLSPQQMFSWSDEEMDYVFNSGTIPVELIFSSLPFQLSKSQAFQQTDIGQSNTYMKDNKIPSPLNLDQYGNIGIGLPTGSINPQGRNWFLGTSDQPDRSWTLGSSDGPDITLNQSKNFFQMPNTMTYKAYYTYSGSTGAGLWFDVVASYPVFIRLKRIYAVLTGNNNPSNQIMMAIFTNQTDLSPENYTNYDPVSLMVNQRYTGTTSSFWLATSTTSNGATTIKPLFAELDYGVWLDNTDSLYIEIGQGMFSSSNTNLYNVTMSIEYETNAPNSTSGYQIYPYEGTGWGSAIGSENTGGSSILIR